MRRILFLLLILCGVVALVWWWRTRPPEGPVNLAPLASQQVPVVSSEERAATWVGQVKAILATFDQQKKADVARDALLALTVNRADQEMHLKLVMAFAALADGKKGAEAQVEDAKRTFAQAFP